MRLVVGLAASLVSTAPSVQAQQLAVPERKVELPADSNLVVGHQARQGRAVLVELVPAGETVKKFTRMVTLQTMPGLARVPGRTVLDAFEQRYRSACPRSTVTAFGAETMTGTRIDCPLHPATGKAETVFARLMNMAPDLAMVQVTMRFVPMPADSRWAQDYLARVAVR